MGVVQGTDGNFYGTTDGGGTNNDGTVFKITPGGVLTSLHSFDVTDGQYPQAGLMQANDGDFYGTTFYGGYHRAGTIFKINSAGVFKSLYSFNGASGENPEGGVLQGSDGNFYGTAYIGGANNGGTVYEMTSAYTVTTVYSLPAGDESVQDGLMQATNGVIYGQTYLGGAEDDGTLFSLSLGLPAFIETEPTFGRVGAGVIILGNDLRNATGVSFGGVAATFAVLSNSEIRTVVPAGALTGTITVTTSGGTLSSNAPFRVVP